MSGVAVLEQREQQKIGWRWVKFNLVGGIGIGVQLAALWVFADAFQWNYLIATALAVETAVLHNFFLHQHLPGPIERPTGGMIQQCDCCNSI